MIDSHATAARRGVHQTVASALFGVALHLVISIVAAGIFVYASRIWPILVHRYVSAGLVYGALVYIVMTYLVLPPSAVTFKPATDTPLVATSFAVHLFFFGLPISMVNRYGGVRTRFS